MAVQLLVSEEVLCSMAIVSRRTRNCPGQSSVASA
jgi:hypothetical protein